MLYEFEFFRLLKNAPENTDEAPTVRRTTREFAYQEAAELYGLTITARHDAEEKADGFRLYAEGKLKKTIIIGPAISNA